MSEKIRLYYLDNLRSFALLLGIIFHAAIVYAEDINYAIQNPERSIVFTYFCYFVHGFRMPLFFMISGFFSGLVWEKKGKKSYIQGRFLRVFIPMMIGLLFFAPIQYYLMDKIKNQNLSFVTFYLDFFTVKNFQQSHLWFLVNLMIYSILFILIPKNIFTIIPNLFRKNSFRFFVFCISIMFVLLLLAHYFFAKGELVMGISKITFFYQILFFFLGIYLYHSNFVFKNKKSELDVKFWALFVWSIVVYILFMEIEINDELWISFQYVSIFWRSYHLFLWLISPILWTLVFVKLFLISVNNSSRIGDYLIEASLPVYLIHHPLSLVYAFFVINLEYSVYSKFIGHVLFVLILSFLIHEFMIRRVGFLRIIFGLKN